jgi:hypothetical protein
MLIRSPIMFSEVRSRYFLLEIKEHLFQTKYLKTANGFYLWQS